VKLIAYRDGCSATMARVMDGGRLAVAGSVEEFWSAPPVGLAAARHAMPSAVTLDQVEQLPPVPLTAHVLCAGRNYAAHAAEANLRVPKSPDLFGRWPSTLIVSGHPVPVPPRGHAWIGRANWLSSSAAACATRPSSRRRRPSWATCASTI